MLRHLRQLASGLTSLVKPVDKRQMQQRLDTHKLFLYTSLLEQRLGGGDLSDGFTDSLLERVGVY